MRLDTRGKVRIYLDATMVADPSMKDLERTITAIIDGRLRTFTAYDPDGAIVADGWQLQLDTGTSTHTHYLAPTPTGDPQHTAIESRWRYEWATHPAWPATH